MSKHNENRPGYKKTKVGWIPNSWKTCHLYDCTVKIGSGITPRGGERAYLSRGIAFIRSQNIQEGYFSTQGLKYISNEQHKVMQSTSLKENDVLYNITGASIGRCCLFPTEIGEANINQHVCIVRSNGRLLPKYLVYLLNSQNGARNLYESQAGGGREGLNFQNLGLYKIPLPPLPEQKKITEILSTWDRAIDQTRRLIDAKQRLKKGLMQQLLTGRMRFSEFVKAIQEKGELPEGWKKCKLKDCFKERKEHNPQLQLLSITSDRGVILRDEVDRKDTSNADKGKYKRIVPGDIGYNTMRMWQGVSAVSELEGIVSPAYTICVPKNGQVSDFYGYLFKYPPVVNLFHRFSQGLVSDTLNLKFPLFAQVKVMVPKEDEQEKIASVLRSCDKEIEQLEKYIEFLNIQKKGLMQKLLTGEVRVNTAMEVTNNE